METTELGLFAVFWNKSSLPQVHTLNLPLIVNGIGDGGNEPTERVSVSSAGEQGNSSSYAPDITADGRYVAFMSTASNLVSGDTNGKYDVFVHDRQTDSDRAGVGLVHRRTGE